MKHYQIMLPERQNRATEQFLLIRDNKKVTTDIGLESRLDNAKITEEALKLADNPNAKNSIISEGDSQNRQQLLHTGKTTVRKSSRSFINTQPLENKGVTESDTKEHKKSQTPTDLALIGATRFERATSTSRTAYYKIYHQNRCAQVLIK